MPAVKVGLGLDIEAMDEEEGGPSSSPRVAAESRAALHTQFETLDEAQLWCIFCINLNDLQLPNQLEGV